MISPVKQLHILTWTTAHDTALTALKQGLASSITKCYPDPSLDWIVRTDASTIGVGGALIQRRQGREEIIAVYSKKLSPAAIKWSVYDKLRTRAIPVWCVPDRPSLGLAAVTTQFSHERCSRKAPGILLDT